MARCHLQWVLPLLALLWVSPASGALPVRVFNTENGLPHNRVNKIYLDSKGFLWICTDDGLSRFDGHRFVNYTTASGLPHVHVNAVLEARTGEYWLATDGGLSRFDPRPAHTRFTNYLPEGPVEARYINALAEDEDGSLLVGTHTGLYRFSGSQPEKGFAAIDFRRPMDPPAAAKVHAIAHDLRGRLWLATEHGLYQRTDQARWNHYGTKSGLPHLFVIVAAKDRDGRVWVVFKGGFGRIAMEPEQGSPVLDPAFTYETGLLGQGVGAIWFGMDGRRWIGTDIGLKEWITDANGVSRFHEHTMQDGLPGGAVLSIGEDAAGNLWIGTRRSGLLGTAWPAFHVFGASDGLTLRGDQALLPTQSGEVAIFDVGDKRNQVYRQHNGRFAVTLPALPASVASIPHWLQMASQDHTGAWWFSTVSGLFRFPTLGGRSDLRLLPDSQVDRFFEDAAGDLWISNWPRNQGLGKLARWERSSGRILDETDRLPQAALSLGISAFAQDRAGALWIGLQRPGGVFRLRNGRFEPLSGNVSGHIARLFIDSHGRLWIASTESGLGLIADPSAADPHVQRYTRAQGLSADEVWCVTEDRQGRIYAGTAHGVDRLNPVTGQIVHYSSADGLVRGDIRSALRDHAGDLWFVSANGVSRYTPSEDRAIPLSSARITGLRTAGVPIPLSEFGETEVGPVDLRSHQNSLQIDFAATNYHVFAPLHYQFRLDREGLADQGEAWQDAETNSTVHLANLAPGGYAFSVRALTPDGLPGKPAVFAFSILQPFWRTWWFQLACAVALAVVAYSIHTQRLHNQLAIERVRSHIAMDLHDDIGASLSRISVISEALKSRLQKGDEDVQRMLNDIAGSSRRLVKDMGDIVWSLDPRRDQMGELASRLRAFGSDLLETRGVEWAVEAPLEELHRRVPLDVRRQLYLVFKEGIHNIGKHSDAKKATLRLQLQDGQISR